MRRVCPGLDIVKFQSAIGGRKTLTESVVVGDTLVSVRHWR